MEVLEVVVVVMEEGIQVKQPQDIPSPQELVILEPRVTQEVQVIQEVQATPLHQSNPPTIPILQDHHLVAMVV